MPAAAVAAAAGPEEGSGHATGATETTRKGSTSATTADLEPRPQPRPVLVPEVPQACDASPATRFSASSRPEVSPTALLPIGLVVLLLLLLLLLLLMVLVVWATLIRAVLPVLPTEVLVFTAGAVVTVVVVELAAAAGGRRNNTEAISRGRAGRGRRWPPTAGDAARCTETTAARNAATTPRVDRNNAWTTCLWAGVAAAAGAAPTVGVAIATAIPPEMGKKISHVNNSVELSRYPPYRGCR